jgi:hypothetical protein
LGITDVVSSDALLVRSPLAMVFDDKLMQRELALIGYDRFRKYIYRASWSTTEVEHFLYFGKDTRQYFTAEFGLRNPDAEELGIEAIAKYGHPNHQLWLKERDAATDCSMTFEFGRLDKHSPNSWPRVRLPEISGQDLAVLVAGFVRQNLLPVIESVTDLETYLAFLVADRDPNRWLISRNRMIRAAQVVAVSAQLGRSHAETKDLLRPHADLIEKGMRHARDTVAGFDMYVDKLISDWASRMS